MSTGATPTSEFRAVITHRPGQMVLDDWHVRVERLSDGKELIRTFAWEWRARGWAKSQRRLRRAFARDDAYDARAGATYEVRS